MWRPFSGGATMTGMRSLPCFLVLFALGAVSCGAPPQATVVPCVPCAPTGAAPAPPAAVASSTAPPPPPTRSSKLDELGRQRLERAWVRTKLVKVMYDRGTVPLSELAGAYRAVALAARDSGLHGDALRRPLQEYRDALSGLRDATRTRFQSGVASEADVATVDSAITEADYWLEEAIEQVR
jgi:hypothetical protein